MTNMNERTSVVAYEAAVAKMEKLQAWASKETSAEWAEIIPKMISEAEGTVKATKLAMDKDLKSIKEGEALREFLNALDFSTISGLVSVMETYPF